MIQQLRHLATFFLLFSIALVITACSDDETNIVELRGVIIEGAGVGQACEYIFQPDAGNYLVPQFIPIQYKQNGVMVFIKGEILTQKATCSATNNDGFLLRIEQISESN
ncbi:MAG: hypothetical protein ACJAXX_001163 [Roseivirga sp.]|jgi:hypothetical protein